MIGQSTSPMDVFLVSFGSFGAGTPNSSAGSAIGGRDFQAQPLGGHSAHRSP